MSGKKTKPLHSSQAAATQMKPSATLGFQQKLLAWYGVHGRHALPWRTTGDAYHIWVSEMMLQQTQVETVRTRYYGPFLEKFPNVQALAAAPREAVMKAWEGLGYYRRAGFLHEASKAALQRGLFGRCVASHGEPRSEGVSAKGAKGGETPPSLNQLLALPGIGRNTAHAILAFGYRQPFAVMEANVKRIVARIFALKTPTDAQLWAGAEALLNRAEPFDHNQAMMDMGALLCTPKAPQCGLCPAQRICKGKVQPEAYPAPKTRKAIPTKTVAVLIEQDAQGRIALEKRDGALLGGLYGFAQHAPEAVPPTARHLGQVRHTYSHFHLIAEIYVAARATRRNQCFTPEEIPGLALSTLDHKILRVFQAHPPLRGKKRG